MKLNYLLVPLITVLVAFSGSSFTNQGLSSWYNNLHLPAIAPPGWLIGLMWTVIYILTTVSALILWNLTSDKWAQWQGRYWLIWFLFALNAFLNAYWSYLFFAKHLIGWAVVEMLLLEATNIALIFLSWKFSKTASLLLLPYFFWVGFATYLAFLIYKLN